MYSFYLGIRLLDGEVTDLVESMALSFRPDFIDIYSASWYEIKIGSVERVTNGDN